jgi:glutamate racemase
LTQVKNNPASFLLITWINLMAMKIGVFDSGIGGLTVLNEIWKALPQTRTCYIADQIHIPYGSKPLEQVRAYSEGITEYLIDLGCSSVVVACNTASAASLTYLRGKFPSIPFIGMEPALKPAAEHTRSGVVGVLATPATFQGALYASVLERFASHVRILQHTCPGLVERIESGELESPETKSILEEVLIPMREVGIDTIVLGCTHYPFVIPLIREITGEGVRVIDPSPAVARQVKRVSIQFQTESDRNYANFFRTDGVDAHQFWTTADPGKLEALLPGLIGCTAKVNSLEWVRGQLIYDPAG